MAPLKKLILHEGKVINVDYAVTKKIEIEEYLGSGGYADIWKVRDIKTSTFYVLKHIVVKKDLKEKEREFFIKRVENEASIDIPSPYVVKSYGLYKMKPDNYAILFQYIPDAVDLKDWLTENPAVPWEKKKKLFLDILKGVACAHSRNIIHRDLKPENILVTKDGIPGIFDFGIAKLKDSDISQSGEMKGTFPYMDPQVIIRGIKYVDARCDIYALGIILYQLTHPRGWNPWQANDIEFPDFIRYLTAGKQHILELDTSHPFTGIPQIKDIIKNCTYFQMKKRYPSVQHMLALLDGSCKMPPSRKRKSAGTPYLVIEDGSAKDAMYPVVLKNGKEKLLGRRNLDITNNNTISRKHCMILRQKDRYFIYDVGSKNGTFFNGVLLKPGKENHIEIRDSDRIRFADLWTRFVFIKQ